MTKAVHVPYTVEEDEDGVWCAPRTTAQRWRERRGSYREEAVDDLREALAGLIAEFGVPDELTVAVDMV